MVKVVRNSVPAFTGASAGSFGCGASGVTSSVRHTRSGSRHKRTRCPAAASSRERAASRTRTSSTAWSGVPSGTRVVIVTRYSMTRVLLVCRGETTVRSRKKNFDSPERTVVLRTACSGLTTGRDEVGKVCQQVVVRLKAGRRDLAVGQPGEAHAVHVVGEHAAVGVGGGLGAVEVQDVGQDLQGGRLGLLGGVAAGVLQDLRPRFQVVGHVVGGLAEVEQVLLPVRVDERG